METDGSLRALSGRHLGYVAEEEEPFGSFSQEEHVYFGRFSFASVASRFASVTSAKWLT